ncbi:MAG TPA: FAD-dependent monooxygenase [Burkholderiaceae bacterium]|nr:FAD-dependent monooxygenase [Burkholderiaceae bacterium]
MTASSMHVLIAGAGIAGLATALALQRSGATVTIVEQSSALREFGAGLQISPNGSRVLLALGLGAALEPVVCAAAAKEVRLWNSGRRWPLFDLGADALARFGAPYWMVHRGDLHRVLLAAVRAQRSDAVRLGAKACGFESIDGGARIALQLDDGSALTADALLAADGVHSSLRRVAFGSGAAEFTGLMAWRGVVPTAALPAALREPVGVNWIGPGGHVITYPLRRGELLNVVGIVERDDWRAEGWSDPGAHAEWRRDFVGWHTDIQRLIDAVEQPYKWALLSRPALPAWTRGRLCLLGDAAHPTLPFLAQGANMALEDAWLIARCLIERDEPVPQALQRFERMRRARCTRIVQGAADNAHRFHNRQLADPDSAVAYVDREWAPERVRQRYDWLFEYDALRLSLH